MVSDDDEHRILEPRLFLSSLKEGPNRVIRIGHPALAVDELGVNLARRPRVRAVVRRRHDEMMEGLAGGMGLVGFLQRPAECVFVTGAPGIAEGRLLAGGFLTRQIHHPVAVGSEEVVHVIEETVAAVDESRVVTLRAQHGTQRREVFAALAT